MPINRKPSRERSSIKKIKLQRWVKLEARELRAFSYPLSNSPYNAERVYRRGEVDGWIGRLELEGRISRACAAMCARNA